MLVWATREIGMTEAMVHFSPGRLWKIKQITIIHIYLGLINNYSHNIVLHVIMSITTRRRDFRTTGFSRSQQKLWWRLRKIFKIMIHCSQNKSVNRVSMKMKIFKFTLLPKTLAPMWKNKWITHIINYINKFVTNSLFMVNYVFKWETQYQKLK